MALKPCKECGKEISTEATACPHCGKKNPTGATTSFAAMGCLTIIVIGVLSSVFSTSNTSTGISQSGVTTPPPQSPKEAAMAAVKLDFTWNKSGFDNIMMATFVITNPTARGIKDIEVTCTHFAASGTKIDSNTRTIYEIVPAKGKKRIPDFNMGFIHTQAKSSSCEITDLVVM